MLRKQAARVLTNAGEFTALWAFHDAWCDFEIRPAGWRVDGYEDAGTIDVREYPLISRAVEDNCKYE